MRRKRGKGGERGTGRWVGGRKESMEGRKGEKGGRRDGMEEKRLEKIKKENFSFLICQQNH